MPAPVINFKTALASRTDGEVVTALLDGTEPEGEAVAILRCTDESAQSLARALSSVLDKPDSRG